MHFPKVLVLGATGRIGTILRTLWPRDAALWQARRGLPGPGWVVLDPLRDPAALACAASGAGAVLCLAGVTPAQAGRGADMADNAALARAAVQAAAQADTPTHVFLASSAAVYGNQAGPLAETVALAPVSDYGRAKAEMETVALTRAAALGVPVTALRIANVAGVDAALGGWRPGMALDRFADGRTPRRSYIGPQTLARVLGALMRQDDLPEALNIAAPGVVEMGALLDTADLAWTPRRAPPGAIAEVCLATDRLAERVALDPAEATPARLVAEWRAVQAADRQAVR